MKTVLLLTGSPGTGKTSIIRKAVAKTELKAGGFYTEEVREDGRRRGFKVVTLDGQESTLADVGMKSPHRVGKYGVDIEAFDATAIPSLYRALGDKDLVVVDEIGKMELLSSPFRETITRAIESGTRVLGTITANPHPYADEIRRHPAVDTLVVTRNTRDTILDAVMQWLATIPPQSRTA